MYYQGTTRDLRCSEASEGGVGREVCSAATTSDGHIRYTITVLNVKNGLLHHLGHEWNTTLYENKSLQAGQIKEAKTLLIIFYRSWDSLLGRDPLTNHRCCTCLPLMPGVGRHGWCPPECQVMVEEATTTSNDGEDITIVDRRHELFIFYEILNQAVPNHLADESQTRLPDTPPDHPHPLRGD